MIFRKLFGRDSDPGDTKHSTESDPRHPPKEASQKAMPPSAANVLLRTAVSRDHGGWAVGETLLQRMEQEDQQYQRIETALAEIKGMMQFTAKSAEKAKRNQEKQFTSLRSHITDETGRICTEIESTMVQNTAIQVFESLLPALDDLDRLVDANGSEVRGSGDSDSNDNSGDDRGRKTLTIVRRRLVDCFSQFGIERVNIDIGVTRFDSEIHEGYPFDGDDGEAIGVAEGTIVEVISAGYRMGNKLIRPASVIVMGV